MKTKAKPSYRVRNWSQYDAALGQRGSLSFWIDEVVIAKWINEQKTGRRGASNHYSDGAIALMATVQALFNLPGRQTEGFVESLFALMAIDLAVPDHSTLSRRMGKVEVELPVTPSEGAIHVVVDSTGVKVYGEGEWKVRQHGVTKRRTWRKLHIGVNQATGEILAAVASTNNVSDDEALSDILEGIDDEIDQVSGDGSYDKRKCYDEIAARGANATIPPPQRCSNVVRRLGNWGGASTQSSTGTDPRQWDGNNGSKRVATTDGLWLKRRCFGSRPSLGVSCGDARLTIRL